MNILTQVYTKLYIYTLAAMTYPHTYIIYNPAIKILRNNIKSPCFFYVGVL